MISNSKPCSIGTYVNREKSSGDVLSLTPSKGMVDKLSWYNTILTYKNGLWSKRLLEYSEQFLSRLSENLWERNPKPKPEVYSGITLGLKLLKH